MGELILTGAGALAGPLQGLVASAAGHYAYNALFPQRLERARQSELSLQTSTDGAPMARIWGRARISGQVIWAARFREHAQTSGGKGGGPQVRSYRYTVSFAVGLCEGVIDGIGRVWANGVAVSLSDYPHRLYTGGEDQAPDALIQAVEGVDAPAFRGTAYIVFEDMPLDDFGGRIPNLSFEVFRGPKGDTGALEARVRGVNLIPGSGEFALDPEMVVQRLGPGRERAENRNTGRAMSDFRAALDDLERDLPACRSVQLVVSWFGNDLRCGECLIRPGIEGRDKLTEPVVWTVAGMQRETAYQLSQIDGRPAYGGTPSDQSVIAAIQELKARGLKVILYPFILMDIPPDNVLPDPGGSGVQPAYPWRGRIRASAEHAPGSAAIDAAVEHFFGAAAASDYAEQNQTITYSGPEEWGLNRFILHCAALAQAAGGVDGFLIGTELVGLTILRGASGHPAVERLIDLAIEARTLLGPECRLSYAADWTEYSGYQDGQGGKVFHLDPLWAHPDIDAVAIDWYAPMSDWREGEDHLDLQTWPAIDDADYLAANIAGGEDFHWYYQSAADRAAQHRTPISDGAHDEAWVWRRKDLLNWWSLPHHDRPAGQRASTPTAWLPAMKPVWLTEIGCPAIDKGSNQPNLFFDPKSSESHFPTASSGARDDMIQRRMIEAQLEHFGETGPHNPVSSIYGGPMVEADWIHVWCWDARPYPDFPARTDVWSDGANWRLGHWLNGRAGQVPLRSLIKEALDACDAGEADLTRLSDMVPGYVQHGRMTVRQLLEPLLDVLGVEMAETAAGLRFSSADASRPIHMLADPARFEGLANIEVSRPDRSGAGVYLELGFLDDSAEYATGMVRGRSSESASDRAEASRRLDLLLDPDRARSLAAQMARRMMMSANSLRTGLPPSLLALEAGDHVNWRGTRLQLRSDSGIHARLVHLSAPSHGQAVRHGNAPASSGESGIAPRPDLAVLDRSETGVLLAAASDPWPGPIPFALVGAQAAAGSAGDILRSATMGYLTAPFKARGAGRWLRGAEIEIELVTGHLAGMPEADVLQGANMLALEMEEEAWALVQFAGAELIGERRYRLSHFLIGLHGTPFDLDLPAGRRAVLMDEALVELTIEEGSLGLALQVAVGRERQAIRRFTPQGRALRPYAPVHLRAHWHGDDLMLSWIRRTRRGGDGWWREEVPLGEAYERFRVELWDGDERVWSGETAEPHMHIPGASTLGGAALSAHVSQLSDRVGAGHWAHLELTG